MFWKKKNKPEVCGYLDDDGNFSENEKNRDLYNLKLQRTNKPHKIWYNEN